MTDEQFPEFAEVNKPIQIEDELSSSFGEGFAVILYDDDHHFREDVIVQLVKALRCDISMANGIVARVEANGKGVVTITSKTEAERINTILLEINLKTQVRKVGV